MNTSIWTIVLANALLAPGWHESYSRAQQEAAEQKKPLAVVFGTGANGWTKVVRTEGPSADVTKLLSESYVRLYVDTASPEGQRVARNFGISGSVGLVISDRDGSVQAFWHQGDLTNSSLERYLQKYADPNVVVRGTETVPSVRTSYYPSAAQSPVPSVSSRSC